MGRDKKQGLAIVIGMSVVDGDEVDAKNMEEAFQELNFAVIKLLDVDINQLYAIITATAKLQVPSSIHSILLGMVVLILTKHIIPFVVTKKVRK